MTTGPSRRTRYIAEILDGSKPVTHSKLTYLSDLNAAELKFFEEIWAKASVARRQQVISQLAHLSEVDFRFDFSKVFVVCLHDPDETIRTQAIACLEGEENYRLISPLIQCLKEDNSSKVRAAAATVLGKYALLSEQGKLPANCRGEIYAALLQVLDNAGETCEVKRRALEAISPFTLPRVKEFIEKAYDTSDVKLKASAIYAMGRNCDSVWLTTLLTELNSKEAELRYEAANACGELGCEEAVPHLVGMIDDTDEQVQEAAIRALGEIGGEQARKALKRLAKSPQPRIRQAAKLALKELLFCEDPLSIEL